MKKALVLASMIAAATVITSAIALNAATHSSDQEAITAIETRIAQGVEARNSRAVLANYVPGDALIVFDAIPPREYRGWEAYRKDWQPIFDACTAAPTMEITDLKIDAERGLAYSHSIQHFACAAKTGKLELTMRTTDVYRKIGGKWLIVHEHNSVPADLATAKADLASQP
jgi:ketosteroid isomerase-like protein